jgi:hypothetical protein
MLAGEGEDADDDRTESTPRFSSTNSIFNDDDDDDELFSSKSSSASAPSSIVPQPKY